MKDKKFGLIGAAGYIAPRHMKAIKANHGQLIAALDPNDSVGQMDSFFPNALFFNNYERFERFVNKLNSQGEGLDYMSICSPNFLHDTHCRFALNNGMHAICEKPLVLNPWNLDRLQRAEEESGNCIYNILQLRLHPEIIALKKSLESSDKNLRHTVHLKYITSRGPWYHISWKGQQEKSGGIASNIGVHFFDMLIWLFGAVSKMEVFEKQDSYAAGRLILEKANIDWFLSVDSKHLAYCNAGDKSTFRSLNIDQKEIEFSEGFERLHDISYKEILCGNGFSTSEVRPVIELIHDLRHKKLNVKDARTHKMLTKVTGSDAL